MGKFPLLIVFLVASCSRTDCETLLLESTPWVVYGTLISKSGDPIPNHEVEFVRIQRSKNPGNDSGLEAKTFAVVKTDAAGVFYFSSAVPGRYEIMSWTEQFCAAHRPLGNLASQHLKVRLTYTDKDCGLRY